MGLKKITSEQEKRRCEIFGWRYPEEYRMGGTRRFKGVDAETIKVLFQEGFLDKGDTQNCSPTAEEFSELMSKYPNVLAHGYVVSPDRGDCRVTIEGIEYKGDVATDMMLDLVNVCRFAETFDLSKDGFYCWYD